MKSPSLIAAGPSATETFRKLVVLLTRTYSSPVVSLSALVDRHGLSRDDLDVLFEHYLVSQVFTSQHCFVGLSQSGAAAARLWGLV